MHLKQDYETVPLTLDDFEGPLDLLVHLIQKKEIHIGDIPLHNIFNQYTSSHYQMETSAEFIGSMAYLMWLKSNHLLPITPTESDLEEPLPNPFEALPHVLEYCQFKEIARTLSEKEALQGTSFSRETADPQVGQKPLGIEHISLNELAHLFQEVLSKAPPPGLIEDEEYLITDLIRHIRYEIKAHERIPFTTLFHPAKPRGALIVTFLAILELLKIGEIIVGRETKTQTILILPNHD